MGRRQPSRHPPSKDELLPGTLDMLVLHTLRRRELHGYGIAQRIRELSAEVLHIEEGSLYPALQRLQLRGWVTSEWRQSKLNRRARYYRLTPAGRKQLGLEVSRFQRLVEAMARVLRPLED